jgi:hypothetical protein
VCGGNGVDEDQDGICDDVDDCVGEFDECGICNGSGIPPNACDCSGNQYDCLGDCGGDAVEDCAGICNGSAVNDCAGICNGNTAVDCDGVCDGSAELDCAGFCNGPFIEDCNGDCNGDAIVDECGVCDGDGSSCGDDGGDDGIGLGGYPIEWDFDGDGFFDDVNAYQNSGSITAAVFIEGVNAGSEGDALAAFVDGVQRGFQGNFAVPFGPYAGTEMFPILIYSNASSGETVDFKFYDAETDLVYNINETVDFVSDMTLGSFVDPITFNIGEQCPDVDEDGICLM